MAECVKVALRIRPFIDSEKNRGCQACVEAVEHASQVVVSDKPFTFNYVFSTDVCQQDVYDGAVKALVHRLFKGYNVTVLAYGQTGSGKTYTMGTNYNGEGEKGVIPLSVDDIFSYVKNNPEWEFKITVSFVELYKEQLYDLLAVSRCVVEIREDTKGICIPGLTEMLVTSTEETMKYLQIGSKGRVTGATAMNVQSSRSHAIFTITIHQQRQNDPTSATTAKFNMVDLAGSERSKKTQAEGDRFKEGVTINAGLLALGNIIAALGEGSKQVPSYRNSKLTRMLQDSLGGNSLTLMIACISPADYNLDETISTLRYADRAKQIKNKPIVNQDPKSAEIAALKAKVQELQLQLLSSGDCGQLHHNADNSQNSFDTQKEIQDRDIKNRDLTKQLNETLIHATEMANNLMLTETALDRVKEGLTDIYNEIQSKLDCEDKLNECDIKTILSNLAQKILGLQDEQQKSEDERRQQETTMAPLNQNLDDASPEEALELAQMEAEHAQKCSKLNMEYRTLSKDIALREAMFEQHKTNDKYFGETLKGSLTLKSHYEKQIAELEKEKAEFISNIKVLEAANKDAEVKAKQIELAKKNSEIEALQKKLAEQSKIMRQKESAEKKVEGLMNEIRIMKQAKVKLIKQMKQETESWKAWRISREKEAAKLRDQDRRRQNEIQKLQALHTKQLNVNKRKLEEALAVNKRLKVALQKQKSVRGDREMRGKKEQLQEFVAREVEVLVSTVDAERTLQLLMEHRAALSAELQDLRRQTYDQKIAKRITEMETDLELRSAQIADMQQKILDSNQESRQHTRWDSIVSMLDAKNALSHAMRLAAEIRREALLHETAHQEATAAQKELQMKLKQLEDEQNLIIERHQKELLKLEKEQQEQMQLILQNYDKENNPTILHKTIELKEKDEEVSQLRKKLEKIIAVSQTPPPKQRRDPKRLRHEYEDLDLSSGTALSDDDLSKDPDWRDTPIHKRLKSMKSMFPAPLFTNQSVASKCACKSNCSTKKCYCKKLMIPCGTLCSCDPSKCQFKTNSSFNSTSSLNSTYTMEQDSILPLKRMTDDKSLVSSPKKMKILEETKGNVQ